ncbi:MAG: transporter substrate-binding domain-containing protein [Candidatus Pacebacteria bacterium]|nr:transporter substrate-binding domain-containing protein [Candidatus Paceibacterota bacterium]MBP9701043.1 transporter substrate-binding domain-containing protein [Candidatus Paceibacterota bacterium]
MKYLRFLPLLFFFLLVPSTYGQGTSLLNPEEVLWLKSRNNTIVVYPEKNYPPFSYQNAMSANSGLSIDIIELIAKKIGVKIEYLPARPLSQIFDDVKAGKGDVVTSITHTKEREEFLYFTENYVTIPAVIVVRKDYNKNTIDNLSDFNGKKVAVGEGYAVEEFIRTNFQRIVVEAVSDDEMGLHHLVLGEVDAVVMDVASLSYYLSKQVLSSVKIVGNTGFDYKLAFGVPKDKEILQSILEKGLMQISTNDREILTDKWIVSPGDQPENKSFLAQIQDKFGIATLVILLVLGIGGIAVAGVRHRRVPFRYLRKKRAVDSLKDEVAELEAVSKDLIEELEGVKMMEKDIKDKIDKLQ